MKKLLFAVTFLIYTLALGQNHSIGHTTITFQDPNRGNRNIETEIYYPATVAGNNTTAVSGEFPVIVFGHGFVMAWSAYENLWENFVPKGYIMVFPRTEGSLASTDHQKFGWDLQFLVTEMQNLGNDSGSLLFNRVASETALMGHSMGGGASFLAADSLCTNGNTNLKTIVGLAPAESNSNGVSSIASATKVTVPSLILSGVQDGVTPPADHHIPIYNSLASDCKTLINVIGGAHCYFANSNFACDFGEGTSSSGISITRTEQHQVTFDFVNLWLDYTLKGNCNDFNTFNDSLINSSRITYNQICATPPPIKTSETVNICQGDNYTFPDGMIGNTSSVHTSNFITASGCDSIIETNLIVKPTFATSESVSICQGSNYTFPDGTTGSNSMVHNSNLTTASGCDSIIETTLTVIAPIEINESIEICHGDTYTFPDGTVGSTSTVHSSSFSASSGCDSIIVTTLVVKQTFELTETVNICQGDSYTFPDGTVGNTATVHNSNLTTNNGCDSIIETTLVIQPTFEVTETVNICQGNSYTFPDGTTGNTSTVHNSNLSAISGCDSIIETTLIVQPTYEISESVEICQGDNYTFPDGTIGNTSSVHESNFTTSNGCDSIIETTLVIIAPIEIYETVSICTGDTYTFPDGTTGNSSTVHTSNLSAISGCDSIIETTLNVSSIIEVFKSVDICQGDHYTFPDGTIGNTSTVNTSSFTSNSGCDSIIETTLVVKPSYALTETATVCQGDNYTFPDGTTGNTSTVYTSHLSSSNGCDSLIETTLIVTQPIEIYETASICQDDSYTFPDGTIGNTSMVHSSQFTAQNGCDSIIETTLVVIAPIEIFETVNICTGDTYTFPDGTVGNTSIVHSSYLTTSNGCDSIIETTLNVSSTIEVFKTVTVCQGDNYTFPDGTVGNTSMVNTSTITVNSGCDSIIETTLNVTAIDTNVVQNSGVLTVLQSNATYQWINCDDLTPVQGETSASFAPNSSGNYAVEVTKDGCTTTSNCHKVDLVGLNNESIKTFFKLYPNPSNGTINIESLNNHAFFIYDTKLSLVFTTEFNKGKQVLNHNLKSGIYIWKAVNKSGGVQSGKLVVN